MRFARCCDCLLLGGYWLSQPRTISTSIAQTSTSILMRYTGNICPISADRIPQNTSKNGRGLERASDGKKCGAFLAAQCGRRGGEFLGSKCNRKTHRTSSGVLTSKKSSRQPANSDGLIDGHEFFVAKCTNSVSQERDLNVIPHMPFVWCARHGIEGDSSCRWHGPF